MARRVQCKQKEKFTDRSIARRERESLMRHQHGFSLIELLIVVEIILIIAAIAIPNLLQAKIAANASAAASDLRTIQASVFAYSLAYTTIGLSASLEH